MCSWFLYLILCDNGSLYAGITNNVQARYAKHVAGRGAKYTRANHPVELIGFKEYPSKSAAAKAEWAIRKLKRHEKTAFLNVA